MAVARGPPDHHGRCPQALAWGCAGNDVWLAARVGSADHVLTSSDSGGSWTDAGRAPDGLTDLAPAGDGTGFAASRTSTGPRLWSVSQNGGHFAELSLPEWVARLGAEMSTS